jgi:hypothetical protein
MTFPVRIEHGNHVINTLMHALPRKGDRVRCSFPASLPVNLVLRVTDVSFNQACDFTGRECPEPFAIVITTDSDPEFAKRNEDAVTKLVADQFAKKEQPK